MSKIEIKTKTKMSNLNTSIITDLTVFDFRGGLSGSIMYSKIKSKQKQMKLKIMQK